jgi:hypothetical protein
MKNNSRKEPHIDSSNPEAVERQLRKITGNLEEFQLNSAQQERLISLTFIDILKELELSLRQK